MFYDTPFRDLKTPPSRLRPIEGSHCLMSGINAASATSAFAFRAGADNLRQSGATRRGNPDGGCSRAVMAAFRRLAYAARFAANFRTPLGRSGRRPKNLSAAALITKAL